MISYESNIKELIDKYSKFKEQMIDDILDILTDGLDKWAEVCADIISKECTNEGNLLSSIYTDPRDKYNQRGEIQSDYAEYVNYSTGPHFPPVNVIKDWAHLRLGITDPKELDKVAWSICRKISISGTKGHYFFESGVIEAENVIVRKIKELENKYNEDYEE